MHKRIILDRKKVVYDIEQTTVTGIRKGRWEAEMTVMYGKRIDISSRHEKTSWQYEHIYCVLWYKWKYQRVLNLDS